MKEVYLQYLFFVAQTLRVNPSGDLHNYLFFYLTWMMALPIVQAHNAELDSHIDGGPVSRESSLPIASPALYRLE